MRRPAALQLLIAVALALAACGTESDDPKRAVDARTEAIHFFPADQPFVALLDTSGADQAELESAIGALQTAGGLEAFGADAAAHLHEAGIDLQPLLDLLDDEDPDDGVADSQAALGLNPTGRPTEDVLIVLVSEQTDEVEAAVEDLAEAAGLSELPEFHSARLFAGRDLTLAVRDGVVLVGRGATRLRAALVLRDADQDEQLDEDQVRAVLDELPAEPPLVAYADVGALEGSDPGVTALALGERAWMRALEETAISITPEPTRMLIEVVAEVDSDAVERGETYGVQLPDEEALQRIVVTDRDARRLVSGEFSGTSAFHDSIVALAPIRAEASLSDDELRATIIASR
jgi:hypothetical protein